MPGVLRGRDPGGGGRCSVQAAAERIGPIGPEGARCRRCFRGRLSEEREGAGKGLGSSGER